SRGQRSARGSEDPRIEAFTTCGKALQLRDRQAARLGGGSAIIWSSGTSRADGEYPAEQR
ncbi:MAG TPA: hypothetical protein VEV61_08375, partial [Streptosporangiaceae bacterium]|nr:hypothetical protein [Streptosporangiaceae bacterium]